MRLCIFGLDENSIPEEVEKAFILATGEDSTVKAGMWKMPRGLKIVIITANVDTTRKPAELGRIRVGYTYCRVLCGKKVSDVSDALHQITKPISVKRPIALVAALVAEIQDT